jgi:mannosyl-oligosaccharide alpha-1,2-mannosidase
MGMGKIFDEALEALDSIDFYYHEKSRDQCLRDNHPVSRGFLGAYDLTEGKYPILLKKATEVADMLYGAFDTRNRMPQTRWQWTR